MTRKDKVEAYYQMDKREKTEKRGILLLANKRLKLKSEKDYLLFLIPFTSMKKGFLDQVKVELIQKTIMDTYLIKVWMDENNIVHTEDMSQTDDWYAEARERKIKKLCNAFGDWDEEDLKYV